jgi:hypothetical protein
MGRKDGIGHINFQRFFLQVLQLRASAGVILGKSQNMSLRRQLLTYLYLRKPDPNAPRNTNMKLMHGMNRISIIVFLIAVIVMIVRLIRH